ncbi:1-phosphofructokinase family hexose kinase [Agrococcus sp. SGAir0287]|uniref:1-phosphofructokinase family hexose kinase n=1 Tax=Agrococcus sp. SGAir0287 TaxID=2070347 RepID=UPI0010CD2189|nr:PfkB family carbohydrate kinase [Agrococcus sp. SGAir0287]QCR18605.1 phosphofructokinase [Agrococcus sp. SGAir0287]
MPRILVFAPAPLLSIAIESHGDEPDVHIHVGGQGVWQARMLRALGADVALVSSFAGEPGRVAERLLGDEGIAVADLDRVGGVNPVRITDRRSGRRTSIVETDGTPLDRHDLDALYSMVLREAADADLVILSGPVDDATLPADVYRRLASDLGALDRRVLVDLAGDRLAAAIEGGATVVKVSHEELVADGLVDDGDDEAQLAAAMQALRERGVEIVAVSRADVGSLVLHEGGLLRVTAPRLQVVDHTGAGDSYAAGLAYALADGRDVEEAIRLGAAAGAINVTHHGLGTGDAAAIRAVAQHVEVERVER